jgi:flagellar brake protein
MGFGFGLTAAAKASAAPVNTPVNAPAREPSGEWVEYRIGHASERLALLKVLREEHVQVVLSAPEGGSITTSLFALDEAGGRIHFSGNLGSPHLAGLIDSDEVVAVAYLQSVKLQFDLHDLVLVHSDKATTLQCPLPQEMFRFQRRDAFRVRPIGRNAPVVKMRHPAVRDMKLALRVVDVSIGGCALWLPHDVPPLQPGTKFADVLVELDTDTSIAMELTVHYVTMLSTGADVSAGRDTEGSPTDKTLSAVPRAGESGVRLGCSWRPLNPSAMRGLQLWIDQTQKRRRMLEAG